MYNVVAHSTYCAVQTYSAVPRCPLHHSTTKRLPNIMKRHHSILNPTVRMVRRKQRKCAPTVQSKVDDVCARFPADHAGTQPNRYALFHLVKGCATVEQGCEQVKIIELVRQLQNGDADTFVEFLANSVDPAGNGTAMDATLWCIGSCTVAPVQAYFVKMEKDLGEGYRAATIAQ
jgi:hypothetical protein